MRPLLAATLHPVDWVDLRYPLLVSNKLDGVRAVKVNGQLLSRTQKPIPNRAVQEKFSVILPDGYDGELIYGSPGADDVYRRTLSKVMTHDETAEGVQFFAFDNYLLPGGFRKRWASLRTDLEATVRHQQYECADRVHIEMSEASALANGFEGLILRDPNGPYKFGRSTLREGIMIKLKRFEDAEAEIIGFEELYSNKNVPFRDERGYQTRSTHQANQVPMDTLGALIVRDDAGREFRIGTGFTQSDRSHLWAHQDVYVGHKVKFKYLPIGEKELPRHPVYIGLRSSLDL